MPAGLLRRLGAMLYDALIVLALWMVTLMVLVTINGHFVYGGAVQSLLFLELFAFFAYFWIRDGQTIGMKAWRIQVRPLGNGARLTLNQVTMRFIGALAGAALFGLGYLWLLFDRERRTWSDLFSGSRVLYVARQLPG